MGWGFHDHVGKPNKLGVPVVGVCIMKGLPCAVYIRSPDYWKLSYGQ